MIDYPQWLYDLCIRADDFEDIPSDGSRLIRAYDGTPWMYRDYTTMQYELRMTHGPMKIEQEREVTRFYEQNKREMILFVDPRDGVRYRCIFEGPPQVVDRPAPFLSFVQVSLLGEREPA